MPRALRRLIPLLLLTLAGSGWSAEAPPGPVCVWTFEDSLRDDAGLGRDQLSARDAAGAIVLPRFVTADDLPGTRGKAVALGVQDGDAAFLSACTSPDVRLGPSYSVAIRFHATKLDVWARLVLHWGPGTRHAYHVAVHNGLASLYHGQADATEAVCEGGTVAVGRWHHLVAVAERNAAAPDQSRLRVYLDGQRVAEAPYDGTVHIIEGEGIGIGDAAGAPSDACRLRGYVDDVRLWNRALAPAEIAALAATR
jgi:hypothetical protein